ncbi:hypothetical protein OHC33_002132 [Knufia fluminis]|uniref:Uncharacterized protein n=1 Tax=Knufia fluminis TaxID=191047 RepID=A0AAN8IAE8_9EURO|nr:hypothetical protein OHC33_002132 [Knufia fluminis]
MDSSMSQTDLRDNEGPAQQRTQPSFATPWDGLDLDLFLPKNSIQNNSIPRLRLDNVLSMYLSILPIGPSGLATHWYDKWDACKKASCYHQVLEDILQSENATALKVSEAIKSNAASRPGQKNDNNSDDLKDLTIQPRKRVRIPGEDTPSNEPPAKRLRITDISPSTGKETRPQAGRESAPSPEPNPTSVDYATADADITLQVYHTHNKVIARVNNLLEIVVEAEGIEVQLERNHREEPITAWDFRASAIFDDLAEQLAGLQNQARTFCQTISDLASELKWLTRAGRTSTNAEHEDFFSTLEKGSLQYWLESGSQPFQIWEDE